MLHATLPTAFVDLETTGSRAGFHRITEIAVICVQPEGTSESWTTLLNPGREIPLQISALTGIHDDMVADAPFFEDIARDLLERLSGHLFVAHNVRFDYGFLRSAFRALEMPFRPKKACTVQLSRQLYPEQRRHNLDALMQRHALTCEPRHRALTDARAIHEWSVKAAAELGQDAVHAAINDQLKGPSLPPHLAKTSVRELPDSSGVYRFIGAENALLYIGKSVNVRSRVLAHFSAANRDNKERRLFEQCHAVEATTTAGELGALLMEVVTIKRDRPLLNRRLRHQAEAYTLLLREDAAGYLNAAIDVLTMPGELGESYGLYRQRSAAKKALDALIDEHNLCRKKLGRESGAGSCFGLQIGRCDGACTGAQSCVAWNMQLLNALGPRKITSWPFRGTVVITEKRGSALDLHVVDQWCYLGTAHHRRDVDDMAAAERQFDLDIYQILNRFIGRRADKITITELG
ncbi:MAG: exonuclease domain-containing protein [Gammaproteobacteria bacterium]